VFAALPAADREAAREALGVMTTGMRRYACRGAARGGAVPYLDDEGELHDYCWVVAGCVGVMLTRMFSARRPARDVHEEARRWELAPVVGESLQLTNILLDWPLDVRRGRCYLPAAWLAEHRLSPAELVGDERPGVRELESRLEALARRALARVPDYLDTLPRSALRYRLFVLWPTLWAARSLDHARRDPQFPWGARRPRLPRAKLWGTALASLLAPHRAGALRRP
jgi:farnesyl-diphosphate farnesyltransferase